MRFRKAFSIACVLVVGASAAAEDAKPVDARTELQAAIDILRTYHMNRDKVDWAKVSADAFAQLGNATKAEDAYPAINGAIAALGEKHTFMQSAAYMNAWTSGTAVGNQPAPYWAPPEGHLLAGGIGFLSLHGFGAGIQFEGAYANGGRAALQKLVAAHVCRFIVDLRANQGGSMQPVLNAADALLGSETLGYWQMTGSTVVEPWQGMTDQYVTNTAKSADWLKTTPVAVLLGAATASAGEFTAIGFKGRPNTRFFGETTAGFVSTNAGHYLPDGARIAVSVGWSTDRLHRQYRTAIAPDEQTPRGQATLDAAIAWLKKQPCSRH
jgi:carboxyl-terminal processing protease